MTNFSEETDPATIINVRREDFGGVIFEYCAHCYMEKMKDGKATMKIHSDLLLQNRKTESV